MLALLLSVSAVAFTPKGELLCCEEREGSVWNVSRNQRLAAGLDRPAGLVFVGERLFVLQRQELTELINLDKDGVCDTYSCVSAWWKVSNDPAECARGLMFADGWFTTTLGTGERIRIALEDGHVEPAPADAPPEPPLVVPAGFGPYSGRAQEAAGSCRLGCGGLVAFVRTGKPVFDLVAVHARTDGFELEFSEPIAPGYASDPALWTAEPLQVRSASVSPDGKRVALGVAGLANGMSVHLRALGPVPSASGAAAAGSEAWYTIRALPKDKPVEAYAPRPVERSSWTALFDGKDASHWRGYKQKELPAQGWVVEDGALVCQGGGGDLVSREEYADFELELEWKISEGGNSGIFFRASEDHDHVWESAPEMQILDDARHPDGRNPRTSAGSNYALQAPPPDVTRPVGMWNRARLVVRGAHVEHWLNGVKLLEYELWSPEWKAAVAASKFAKMPGYGLNKSGRIALQDHGDRVAFRDIRIRPPVR